MSTAVNVSDVGDHRDQPHEGRQRRHGIHAVENGIMMDSPAIAAEPRESADREPQRHAEGQMQDVLERGEVRQGG